MPLSEYRKLSDEALVHRYTDRKDQAVMPVLYERYAHLVLGVCCKYLGSTEAAREATRQIFLDLTDALRSIGDAKFRPWLMERIRIHCNRQHAGAAASGFDERLGSLLQAEPEQQNNLLQKAMEGLKPQERQCIELFYLRQMNCAAIAERTGLTEQQVQASIQSGRQLLKKKLEAAGGAM